jgi:hypothetical protein
MIEFLKANRYALGIALFVMILVANSRYVPEDWGWVSLLAGAVAFFVARQVLR